MDFIEYWVFSSTMWFTCVLWKLFCFIPCLKDFVLVNKFFHLTSCDILHLVEFFKQSLFSNLFLKTPTIHGWLDGRSCSCILYSENHFKLEPWLGGRLYELYHAFIVMSIGIIELFQLVSFWSSCILIFVLYVCMISIPRISISIGIYFPYIYIFVFMLSLSFNFVSIDYF